MSYYHLPTSTERNPGRLEVKLSDGAQLGPPDTGWTPELAALCGFVVIVDTARPNDTAQDTYTRSVTLPAGIPTVTWTARPWTQAELDARAAEVNRVTLGARVQPHIDALKLIKNSTGTLTGLQLSNAVRALAAAQLDTLRFLHSRLDALD